MNLNLQIQSGAKVLGHCCCCCFSNVLKPISFSVTILEITGDIYAVLKWMGKADKTAPIGQRNKYLAWPPLRLVSWTLLGRRDGIYFTSPLVYYTKFITQVYIHVERFLLFGWYTFFVFSYCTSHTHLISINHIQSLLNIQAQLSVVPFHSNFKNYRIVQT